MKRRMFPSGMVLAMVFALMMPAVVVLPPAALAGSAVEAAAEQRRSPLGRIFRREGAEPKAEDELVALVNEERRKAGLNELEVDERLQEAARRHTEEMVRQNTLSHDLPGQPGLRERLAQTDVRVDAIAENVAYNADAASAHAGLMSSEGHRRNIMNPRYNAIGVGALRSGGRLYVTQVFANRLPEHSDEIAEELVAESFNHQREQGEQPRLRYVLSQRLREMACEMAQRDQLDVAPLRTDPGMRSVVAYTITEPERLPPQAQKQTANPKLGAFAVGACYARSAQYPTGIHWVILAFYE